MKNLVVVLFISMLSLGVQASGGAAHPMDHIETDVSDKESLQKGFALFSNYCFGCHSLKYARYERTANDIQVPHNIMDENILVGDTKIGQLMTNSMSPEQGKVWFGNPPPDLTLSARLRGPDWLYNYLRGFYADAKRPYGVNNVVFKDVGMPHVLADLQGVCAEAPQLGIEPVVDPLSGNIVKSSGCQEYAVEGVLSPAEYDEAMYDLVNFLTYVGEPSRAESEDIGRSVLIFLLFLFIFAYFLNKEYWRDIH
ncbi:MAG: ubiquinol-cytochrome c reductase cytochrome c1 subunit [Oleiphilaceae bacterium]|jgi:ubiquinol-cytochrome c reductase cytochrome c1 subunit